MPTQEIQHYDNIPLWIFRKQEAKRKSVGKHIIHVPAGHHQLGQAPFRSDRSRPLFLDRTFALALDGAAENKYQEERKALPRNHGVATRTEAVGE